MALGVGVEVGASSVEVGDGATAAIGVGDTAGTPGVAMTSGTTGEASWRIGVDAVTGDAIGVAAIVVVAVDATLTDVGLGEESDMGVPISSKRPSGVARFATGEAPSTSCPASGRVDGLD